MSAYISPWIRYWSTAVNPPVSRPLRMSMISCRPSRQALSRGGSQRIARHQPECKERRCRRPHRQAPPISLGRRHPAGDSRPCQPCPLRLHARASLPRPSPTPCRPFATLGYTIRRRRCSGRPSAVPAGATDGGGPDGNRQDCRLALLLLQRLATEGRAAASNAVRALVPVPTRELADRSMRAFAPTASTWRCAPTRFTAGSASTRR